nr:uncharacterized protein LOC121821104 [Peromyscus maniculatus bairdii]
MGGQQEVGRGSQAPVRAELEGPQSRLWGNPRAGTAKAPLHPRFRELRLFAAAPAPHRQEALRLQQEPPSPAQMMRGPPGRRLGFSLRPHLLLILRGCLHSSGDMDSSWLSKGEEELVTFKAKAKNEQPHRIGTAARTDDKSTLGTGRPKSKEITEIRHSLQELRCLEDLLVSWPTHLLREPCPILLLRTQLHAARASRIHLHPALRGLRGIDVFKHVSPVNSVFCTLPSPVVLITPGRKWTVLNGICQRRAQSKLTPLPYCPDLIPYYIRGLKSKPTTPGRICYVISPCARH